MPEYIPSPRQWVRDQVELYERSGGREGTTDTKAKKPGAAANLQEAPALEGMPDKSKPKPN